MSALSTGMSSNFNLYLKKHVGQSGLNAMLAIKRSAGVAPNMNLGNLWVTIMQMRASTLTWKPKEDITKRLEQGYQWPQKKRRYSPVRKVFEIHQIRLKFVVSLSYSFHLCTLH